MSISNILYVAIAKSMLSRYIVYAANVASMIVLARLFTPTVFGVVASILVFFVFFQIMAEAGLGPAIINLEKLSNVDRDGLFGLTLTAGLILGVGFDSLSPALLYFYQIDRVDEVVRYVAIALFFFTASIVPTAFLLRDQLFHRIAYAGLAAEIISTAMAVILVRIIDPLHALAAKATISAVVNFLMIYLQSSGSAFGRPLVGMKFSAIKPLFSFSAHQLGFNFINYFSRNLDNILVGKYLGAASLGVYDKAYQLMKYPLMLLTFAMTPAIQPVLRRYAADPVKVEEIHIEFTFRLSLLGAAAAVVIFSFADLIVDFILGAQWDSVAPVVRVLAISIPAQVVMSTSGSFFQAMRRADLLFLCGVLSAVVIVAAIAWGVYQRDLVSLSWALVCAFLISFFQVYYVMYSKIFSKSSLSFFIKMTPSAAVTLIMAMVDLIG
jgi:O-antigen/teichoic acid export membrane protein